MTCDVHCACTISREPNSFTAQTKISLELALSQPNLYPTVGLQTPGEVVDANFGQAPFVFDIGDMINELRVRTRLQIINYPTPDHGQGQWQEVLHKYVYVRADGSRVRTARSSCDTTGSEF